MKIAPKWKQYDMKVRTNATNQHKRERENESLFKFNEKNFAAEILEWKNVDYFERFVLHFRKKVAALVHLTFSFIL